jgi:hypothetical protein
MFTKLYNLAIAAAFKHPETRPGEPAALMAAVAKRLSEAPRDAALWTALGAIQHGRGEARRALSSLRNACSIDPDNVLARSLLGSALLCSGELIEGAKLYRERWTLPAPPEPMRYDPALLWDGCCEQGKRLLLWSGADADPALALVRLAPLLEAQGLRVALDLPPQVLELVCKRWPHLHPGTTDGKFDCHYPLEDLISLWVNPSAEGLRRAVAPLPAHTGATPAGMRTGAAVELSRRGPGAAALQQILAAEGLSPLLMNASLGWTLVPTTPGANPVDELWEQLAAVDGVVTTSALIAHAAGLAGKPFVYLRSATDTWCWGAGDGPSVWYDKSYSWASPLERLPDNWLAGTRHS